MTTPECDLDAWRRRICFGIPLIIVGVGVYGLLPQVFRIFAGV